MFAVTPCLEFERYKHGKGDLRSCFGYDRIFFNREGG